MLYEKEVKTARRLMSRLEEIEEMQEYKIMILKVAKACEESATVTGAYIDVLIAEFKILLFVKKWVFISRCL